MPWSREYYRLERLAQYQNFVRAPRCAPVRVSPRNPRRHTCCPRDRGRRARRALKHARPRRQVNCPDIPHDSLEQECAGVSGGAQLYEFRHNARTPRCTVVRAAE